MLSGLIQGLLRRVAKQFMTRLTDASDKDLPNSRLINSPISDSAHRPNSNLNSCGELSRTARAIQGIASGPSLEGRPEIGLANSASGPPDANATNHA